VNDEQIVAHGKYLADGEHAGRSSGLRVRIALVGDRGLQLRHVEQVLGTPRSPLIADQIERGKQRDPNAPVGRDFAARPSLLEGDTVDLSKNIDPIRSDTEV